MSLFRTGDLKAKNQTITSKKIRLPTQSKTVYGYCYNCNTKNKVSAKICTQCEITIHKLSKRKLK